MGLQRRDDVIEDAAGNVESLGEAAAQIVVERAMYNSAGGVFWAAGTSALGTKLR